MLETLEDKIRAALGVCDDAHACRKALLTVLKDFPARKRLSVAEVIDRLPRDLAFSARALGEKLGCSYLLVRKAAVLAGFVRVAPGVYQAPVAE